MTRTRARLLAALHRHSATALAAGVAVDSNTSTSLLQAHKVIYLLQAGGLKLGYLVDATVVARHVAAWSPRKKRLFPPEDVHAAWHHLQDASLLDSAT